MAALSAGRFVSSSSSSTSATSDSDCPALAKRRRVSKLTFKPEWKQRFLVWPAGEKRATEDDEMICVLCNERMKAKCSTANRHQVRKHPHSKTFSEDKKARFLKQFQSNLTKQQATMRHAIIHGAQSVS